MKKNSWKSFAIAAACILPLSACQQGTLFTNDEANAHSKYQIKADLTDWKMVKQENDPQGYYKIYEPVHKTAAQEEILINYGKGITTSLVNSAQQIINVDRQLPCSGFNHKIIAQAANTLTLKVKLDHCQPGPNSLLVYTKIFNADDGQYSIKYSVIATNLNQSRNRHMKQVVLNSSLE